MTRRLPALFLAIGAFMVMAGCNHDQPTPVQIHTSTVAAPPPLAVPKPHQPVDQFGDGKYEVLVDILPGQYKTNGPGDDGVTDKCYWARLKDFTGAVTSVNAMQYGERGPDVVVIEPSDKGFETRSCGIWMRVK
jgi:hypothetical protein